MNRRWVWILLAVLGLGGIGLWVKSAVDAQRPKGDDRQQLMQMLATGAAAAERKSARDIGKLLSESYRDSNGYSESSLIYQINAYFREHRSIRVRIPESRVQIAVDPAGKTAQVSFYAELDVVGNEAISNEPVTGGMDISLRLEKEKVHYFFLFPGEEWKIVSADGYAPI